MSSIIELNDGNFNEVISKNRVVIIDFTAKWCAPCRFYGPIFSKISERYAGKAVFARVDVDNAPETSSRYGIYAVPTTLIIINGNVVENIVGLVSGSELEKIIQKYIT